MGRVLVLLFVCAASAGCALLSGLSNLDIASDAGTSDAFVVVPDGSDAAVPQDDCDCGVAAPAGFSSVVFLRKDDGTSCPQYTTKESAYADPQSVAATGACSCGCTVGGCTPATVGFHLGSSCGMGSSIAITGGCQASPSNYASATFAKPTFGAPTCTSGAGTFPKAYSDKVTVCTSQLGHCAQFCPSPNGAPLCWVAPGDVACPAPLKKNLIGALTDTRSCTGCSCSVSPNTACLLNVHAYSDSTCTTPLLDAGATWLDGSCGALAPPSGPYMIGQVGPLGSCTSSGGTASGGAAATAIRTVCCP